MTCQDCPSEKIFARGRCQRCYVRHCGTPARIAERRAEKAALAIQYEAMLRLLDTGEHTLQEVGARFGLSRQRVQQIYIEHRGMTYQPVRRLYQKTHPNLCTVCHAKPVAARGMCKTDYDRWLYHSSEEHRENHAAAVLRWSREHREEQREYNRVYQKLYRHRKKWQETAEQREQRRAYDRTRSKLYYQRKKAEALERERR